MHCVLNVRTSQQWNYAVMTPSAVFSSEKNEEVSMHSMVVASGSMARNPKEEQILACDPSGHRCVFGG